MRYNKKYKRGLFLLSLLLLLTVSVSFITINPKINTFDEDSVFLSASDDLYEPNDDYTTAFDLTNNFSMWLSSIYGLGNQSDDDWYQIDVAPEFGHLIIECSFSNMSGNIDMDLYDSSDPFNPVATSWTENDYEYIYYNLPWSGIYYIKIHGLNNTNNYDLRWVGDDNYEENDDFGSATYVDPNFYFDLTILDGDEDWFKTYLNSWDTIDLSIYFNHSDGDLQFELYDPFNSHRTESYSSDNNEFIYYTVDMAGDWCFRVYHEDANSSVFYDLDILVYPVDDDWMEENDDIWNAKDVNPNLYSGLKIVHGDEDWFKIYLNPSDIIDIRIYFNHSDGDLQLEFYDPNDYNNPQSISSSTTNDEFISFTTYTDGDWRIRVYHADANSEVYYDLEIWLYGVDDWMEENDDYWSASYVDPNHYSGLKILTGDEDWFSTYLNFGDTIDISIYFDNYQGDLQLELYDPNHPTNLRAGSYSNYSDEFISFTADYSGDWRIRVYHADANSEVFYDLDIWLYSGDDWMEENDDYWSARWVDANYYPDLMIIEDDDDWFRTYLNVGDTIDINIYFDNFEGDLQLELYDPDDSNNLRDGSYSSHNDEFISFTADISGDWRFRIYHEFRDSNVRYHLEIRLNGMIGGDDPYEPNNNFYEAYDLHDDERMWLSNIYGLAVQGDDDIYRIDVTPGFQNLIVNFKFNRSRGKINVDIYKLEGMQSINWITANYSMSGDDRMIDINCSHIDPGIYFIQVTGSYNGTEYNLWWDDLRTDFRPDDSYEENDGPMTAYDLSFHQYEDLWRINGTAIQKDNDWYKISVGTGFEHLFVLLRYDYQEGALGIEIIDMYGSKVTDNWTEEDNEIISFDLPSNGTYYIRIIGDWTGNIYSLFWRTMEPEIEEMIPGYDIFILLGAVFGVVVVFTLKWKRSKKQLSKF